MELSLEEFAERYMDCGIRGFDGLNFQRGKVIGFAHNAQLTLNAPYHHCDAIIIELYDGRWGWKHAKSNRAWYVVYDDDIQIVDQPNIRKPTAIKTCKICGAKSFKLATLNLCSNQKCKSRKAFKKYLASIKKAVPIALNDNDGRDKKHAIKIVCPVCQWPTLDL